MNTETGDGGLSEAEATEALMASLDAPEEGAGGADEDDAEDGEDPDVGRDEGGRGETDEAAPEADDPDEGGSEEDGEGSEDGDAPSPPEIADDTPVALDIGGENRTFTVAQLKEFAKGAEEVSAKSKAADQVGGYAAAALQEAIRSIGEDLDPYQSVDWLVLQQSVDPATFRWHRENAQKLEAKHRRLMEAVSGFERAAEQRGRAVSAADASAAIRELSRDIPGWGQEMYRDVLRYGADAGLDPAELAQVNNAKVLKIIHKAMLYDNGKKVATKKVDAAPTRTLNRSATSERDGRAVASKKAMKRLEMSGAAEDAVAVLMGRLG